MKTIKRRFTPVRVLDILTEIKILCKRNEFVPKTYSEKQPSVWHFTRALIKKGVLLKERGEYKWTGGEPNIEMAKGIIDFINEYNRRTREEYKAKIEKIKNATPEPIDFQPFNDLQMLQFEEPKTVVEISEEYSDTIKDLKKQIHQYELDISELLKENEHLRYLIHQTQEAREEKKSTPKKVKFLGFTILKIEE